MINAINPLICGFGSNNVKTIALAKKQKRLQIPIIKNKCRYFIVEIPKLTLRPLRPLRFI